MAKIKFIYNTSFDKCVFIIINNNKQIHLDVFQLNGHARLEVAQFTR